MTRARTIVPLALADLVVLAGAPAAGAQPVSGYTIWTVAGQ